MDEAERIDREWYDLGFYVQRNIRYHMRRGAFFLRWGRFTAFVGVMFGSAAVSSLLADADPRLTAAAAVIVTLSSALDLVVGTGQQAWLHNDLRKRYLEIEGEMLLLAPAEQAERIREFKGRIRKIEADEPPTLPALELIARDDVIRALFPKDEADEQVCKLGWFKRATAQWVNWDTSDA
jgi:hypothetical protein